MFNLALIHESIAEKIPEREAIVFRDRRISWRELTDRTRRLADLLRSHGLGCHTERSKLENWQSGQDHVGLYLRNGNEYLEGMLGAFKARAVPFNVNYRYVDDELISLLDDADARALLRSQADVGGDRGPDHQRLDAAEAGGHAGDLHAGEEALHRRQAALQPQAQHAAEAGQELPGVVVVRM